MKKFFALLIAVMMVFGVFSAAVADETPAYKIAIMTGTTSQGEEEYYAATSLAEQYPDIVIHDTYPDNFSSEVETTISKLIAFASDPEVKAIIFVQAVQGATAAFTQILNDMGRDDILLIAGVPAEDPADISAVTDIVLANDEIGCGYQVADLASQWDCDVLVHYSFARHLSYETIVAKRDAMKATAESYGIEFIERDCPDPTGDAGMSGAQAAVLEDIPKVMEEYAGKKVCFYCTNCGLQVALQQAIVNQANAYYALPCCPSPYHGFQEAFGLTATYGDIDGAIKNLANYLNEHDAINRFSTWSLPVNMSMINAGFSYACAYAEGKTDGKVDMAVLSQCFAEAAGSEIELGTYVDASGVEYDNYLLIALEPINFADYLD
ncbi:MAG: DUF3798 domain-containing protein [Clostridia bacterium]|nr:DUF3798 domain-containing protein [Clostridia bacterium]MBR4442738.1 DUF3798 domain-containing protein [Clostridia bacterium]